MAVRLDSFLWLWFQCHHQCPLSTYQVHRVSLTLDWGISSPPLLLTLPDTKFQLPWGNKVGVLNKHTDRKSGAQMKFCWKKYSSGVTNLQRTFGKQGCWGSLKERRQEEEKRGLDRTRITSSKIEGDKNQTLKEIGRKQGGECKGIQEESES